MTSPNSANHSVLVNRFNKLVNTIMIIIQVNRDIACALIQSTAPPYTMRASFHADGAACTPLASDTCFSSLHHELIYHGLRLLYMFTKVSNSSTGTSTRLLQYMPQPKGREKTNFTLPEAVTHQKAISFYVHSTKAFYRHKATPTLVYQDCTAQAPNFSSRYQP